MVRQLEVLERQVKNECTQQRNLQREMNRLAKLRLRLTKSKHGAVDVETQIYQEIFDIDEKIKEKHREIELINRSLKQQDTTLRKHINNAFTGQEASDLEKKVCQNESLHRQIRSIESQGKVVGEEIEKLEQRRLNLQELIENRNEVF